MGGIVVPDDVERLRADDVLRLVERERVLSIPVVGDAMARPLIDEIESGDYDLSCLISVTNGGAPMSPAIRDRIRAALPNTLLIDAVGSSEAGQQMTTLATGDEVQTAVFNPQADTAVVAADYSRVLAPRRRRLRGLAGPSRPDPAGLSGRRGQDRKDLPHHRRGALVGARRQGALPRRRPHRTARP